MHPSGFGDAFERTLGHQYRIEREIGRGGMGIVYRARDLTLDRLVAIKVVHPELAANPTIASRFLAEARTVAKLRHPHIVTIHSAGDVEGYLYYVMDHHEGETLRQRLVREGRLTPELAIRIAADIASALDAASSAGVVHRDLKPENILLEGPADEPRALLTDFGIAHLVDSGSRDTAPGGVMGTPSYMSPEQAAGELLDGRSDLYSLGIVTYEMLTGKPPFVGSHRVVLSKQILDQPAPIDSIRSDLPIGLGSVVMRSLEKIPDARWATGKAYRRALTGEDATPTPIPLPARPRRRNRWVTVVAVAATVALMVRAWMPGPDGPPAGVNPHHSVLVLPFDNTRAEPAYDWLRDGSVNMLSLTLSQWHDLTVIDQDRVHDLLARGGHTEGPIGLDLARRLARQSGVWTVVLGDYTRVGDSLHLVARRYDVATGRRIDVVEVAGPATDDVRPLFDDLAARLLDLTGAPKEDRATLAAVTTSSLEAYRSYLHGIDALNQWRLAEASEALTAAVRLDSTFALANYRLAIARGWVSPEDTVGTAAIRRAARNANRLPPRKRALIDGYRTFIEGDYDRALEIYATLLSTDSLDIEAWYGSADAAFHAGYDRGDLALINRSLRDFRRVIALDSAFGLAYEHMGATLIDAGRSGNRMILDVGDSLAPLPRDADSVTIDRARARAIDRSVALAEAWTRRQPNTARAHYNLYKSYLAGNRTAEARRTLSRLRQMHPDSSQGFFGLLEARTQFVAGDIRGSAQTVRRTMPQVRPEAFGDLDLDLGSLLDMMTGVEALGYVGDLEGAAEMIRLSRNLRSERVDQRDATERAREDDLWEMSRLGLLYGASGSRPERLRNLWTRSLSLVRRSTDEKSTADLTIITPIAVAMLTGPTSDPSGIFELERLTGRKSPAVLRALIAARAGDSVSAAALLAQPVVADPLTPGTFNWRRAMGDPRPIVAETYFELGDAAAVVRVLRTFQPNEFSTGSFDPRWILLPRVRLLRGQAFERLGRAAEAGAEYEAVVAQWGGADEELLPTVQVARNRLAYLAGTREGV